MITYCDGFKIPMWFGDFGGNICVNDTDFARLSHPIERYEQILTSEDFEKTFRAVLKRVLPCSPQVRQLSVSGKELRAAPALARYYNLAGHLSLAALSGAECIFVGTFDREMALLAGKESRALGMRAKISLSRALSGDADLIQALTGLGAAVDTKAVFEGFDLPYGQAEAPFERDPKLYPIPLSANYGVFPKPGLSGIFAGIYGADLLETLGSAPGCTAIPVDTGLEALGICKAFRHTDGILCTCEALICCEYHGCDTGTYTLIKKNADQETGSVSICPELAAMWRSGRVARLGCDRFGSVDTASFRAAGLSEAGARTAALAMERYADVLVIDKEAAAWNV